MLARLSPESEYGSVESGKLSPESEETGEYTLYSAGPDQGPDL